MILRLFVLIRIFVAFVKIMMRPENRMNIALDFDDTFTADIEFWGYVINKAKILGHNVICVTARLDSECNLQEIKKALPGGIQVIMCSGRPKKEFCLSNDITIDVWIDDQPEAIVGAYAELTAAYNEVERLHLLVQECREQRDQARNDAIVSLQNEMAALRAEVARLRHFEQSYIGLHEWGGDPD